MVPCVNREGGGESKPLQLPPVVAPSSCFLVPSLHPNCCILCESKVQKNPNIDVFSCTSNVYHVYIRNVRDFTYSVLPLNS